jgi:hypothetical protein
LRISYHIFHDALRQFPVFSLHDIRKKFPDFDKKRLTEWHQKGYVQPFCRGYYIWPGVLKDEKDLWAAACRVYAPAYISLQSALGFYGIIPEGVFSVTAITTKKTRSFQWGPTHFFYQAIQPHLLMGYFHYRAPGGLPFGMAYPEKALLDLLYLHPDLAEPVDFEALRLNRMVLRGLWNTERTENLLGVFNKKTLEKRYRVFEKWMKHDDAP